MNIFNKVFCSIVMLTICLCSCDDTTGDIGNSTIDDMDKLNVAYKSFPVKTESVSAGSVYSRSTIGYLGKVKDPQTGAFLKSDFITQFYTLEGTQFPDESHIQSRLSDGSIIADSCIVYLYYDNYYGDSLATMKVNAIEMAKPLSESKKYYTDFNPQSSSDNYLRTDGKGVSTSKTYSLYDNAADTMPKKIGIKLPNSRLGSDGKIVSYAYTDNSGKPYYNYGTYLLQKYYENPKYYKDAYSFIHNVCPGFYFKSTDGIGSLANINISQLLVYYRYSYKKKSGDIEKDTTVNVVTSFAGTEEVLQTSTISNDNDMIAKMLGYSDTTYVKSPAGIYTQITLPVDEIMDGHENDTINSAKISLTRMNNNGDFGYNFSKPSTLLMLQTDSLKDFFEQEKIADYKESFLAVFASNDDSYSSSGTYPENTYTFHNVSSLITNMYRKREKEIGVKPEASQAEAYSAWHAKKTAWEAKNPNWNKVLVVPVTATYMTVNNSSILVKVLHDMSLTMTRLQRGDGTENSAVKINVIYSKFKKD